MQQTKAYWRFLAVAGVVSAFVASACVVTTSTDDDNTPSAGSTSRAGNAGTAGSGAGTAGASAGAGAGGTAGASPAGGSGAVPFQCDPVQGGAVGTPNDCIPRSVPANDCEKCIQTNCCAEWGACYATDPGNQCGWGGPATVGDDANLGGEEYCITICIQDGVALAGTAPDDELVGTCGNNCATSLSNGAVKECGAIIGTETNALVGCQMDHCSVECFGQ